MGENSNIEWTDHTFNPWIGCTKVAAGCQHCYAEMLMDTRYGKVQWGPTGTRVKTSDANWRKPWTWNRAAENGVCRICNGRGDLLQVEVIILKGEPVEQTTAYPCDACHGSGFVAPYRARVFCASLADVFEDWGNQPVFDHKGIPIVPRGELQRSTLDDIRRDLFELIDATPHLDWLLLTKRPENIRRMWTLFGSDIVPPPEMEKPFAQELDGKRYRPNVWLLTSIATQADYDRNRWHLADCRDLVPVIGYSAEPLLGAIDFGDDFWESANRVDWVIVGGESGPHARPMHGDWARSLRDQCQAADVPFFFKQWGEWLPFGEAQGGPVAVECSGHPQFQKKLTFADGSVMCGKFPHDVFVTRPSIDIYRVGKQAAGRLLDGVLHDAFPESRIPNPEPPTPRSIMTDFGCLHSTIHLNSGRYLDLVDPQPADIGIDDIACALTKICRFGGQIDVFYSVADHSMNAALGVREDESSEPRGWRPVDHDIPDDD